MRITPEYGNVGIVLLGSFNPPIFRPEWFAKTGIISDEAAATAEIEVIHKQISAFRMAWASLRIESESFVAETDDAPYVRLFDLIMKTFRERLEHTPLWAVGINRRVHFRVRDVKTRDAIGKRLAPPEAWGEWGAMVTKELNEQSPERHGGMLSLTMQQRMIGDDRPGGSINARIEPSTRIPGGIGVFMEINDHYELPDRKNVVGCDQIIALLERNFESSLKRSEWIIDQIMALG